VRYAPVFFDAAGNLQLDVPLRGVAMVVLILVSLLDKSSGHGFERNGRRDREPFPVFRDGTGSFGTIRDAEILHSLPKTRDLL